jgi:SAM-dependent methyltransferase
MTEEQLKSLASQLGNPTGDMGIEVGNMMQANNHRMTSETIEALALEAADTVLELGHGNGSHVPGILHAASGVHYTGLEISGAMHQQARLLNGNFITADQADFVLYNGQVIPFEAGSFSKIMTVNTIYFWNDPLSLLGELYRVLKPGGVLCVTFAQKDFMKTLPFTRFGFTLYDTPAVRRLALQAGFSKVGVIDQNEEVISKAGDRVSRDFSIARLTK